MIALADAVMPIIRLLVAVAMRSGTPITRCMTGTLTIPPPMPSSAETTPAHVAPTTPRPEAPDTVALAREPLQHRPAGVRSARGSGGVSAAASAGASLARGAPTEHRDRDVDEQDREQARQHVLVEEERDATPPTSAPIAVNSSRVMPEPQVRDVALEVHARGRAAGHDHADQRDPDRLAERQAEAEGEQRDDAGRRRPSPSSDPNTPAATPPATISRPTTTSAVGLCDGGRADPSDQQRRSGAEVLRARTAAARRGGRA